MIQAIDPDAVARATAAALPAATLRQMVDVFQALADTTRARIVHALLQGPICVRDLAIIVGVSESAVSHQLRVLRDRHVVTTKRTKTVIYYTLANQHLAALFQDASTYAAAVRHAVPDTAAPADERAT